MLIQPNIQVDNISKSTGCSSVNDGNRNYQLSNSVTRVNHSIGQTKLLDLITITTRINNLYSRCNVHTKPLYSTTGDIMNMRISTKLILTAFIGSLMLLGSGCSKKTVIPPDSNMGTDSGKTISYPSAEGGGYSQESMPIEGSLDDTSQMGDMAASQMDEQTDEYKKLHGRSSEGFGPVYFNFDQATIRPDMVERMVLNSEYMKQVPNSYVVIEGNTDDRGTNEYNIALAERRAQNTKQYMIELGINPTRMRTVSYGEEKPLFTGQDEDSYAFNRRADFVVE
jgi:peptidoglycan-associated lipoprotein